MMNNSEQYQKLIKEKNATTFSGGNTLELTDNRLDDLLCLLLEDSDWDWVSEICLGYDIDQEFTREEQENGTSADCLQKECLKALIDLNKRGGLIAWAKEYGLERHLEEIGIIRKYDKEGNKNEKTN